MNWIWVNETDDLVVAESLGSFNWLMFLLETASLDSGLISGSLCFILSASLLQQTTAELSAPNIDTYAVSTTDYQRESETAQ